MRLGARSPQRASIVVPGDILIQELVPIDLLYPAVHPRHICTHKKVVLFKLEKLLRYSWITFVPSLLFPTTL